MLDEANDSFNHVVEWAKGFKGFQCHVELKEVPGAGHGLVTTSAVKANETLLLLPAAALLNPLTILASAHNTIPSHLFPGPPHKPNTKRRRVSISQRLNTTQLLTLHLGLTRDPENRHKSAWDVYLGTLPTTFRPWHPLTWLVPPTREVVGYIESGKKRLDGVPHEARENVLRVKKRFDEDLEVLQKVLKLEEPFLGQGLHSSLSVDDLLWAWLIVNTRSVSMPLGLGTPNDLFNHTLVPILDLANHSSSPDECISKPLQVPTPGRSSLRSKTGRPRVSAHLVPGKIAFELHSERNLEVGQELRFEYHPHANSELWAEYGFAQLPKDGDWGELRWGQVDVTHHLKALWDEAEDKVEKEGALKACGCYGVNTLVVQPEVGASHGLLMTLRVLHLLPKEKNRLKSIGEAQTTYISPSNEALVDACLKDICQRCIKEGKDALDKLKGDKGEDWGCARTLWEEQVGIASLVPESIEGKSNGH